MSGGSEVKAADAGGESPWLHEAQRRKLGETGESARRVALTKRGAKLLSFHLVFVHPQVASGYNIRVPGFYVSGYNPIWVISRNRFRVSDNARQVGGCVCDKIGIQREV
jgi:hypothetical protein